MIGRPTIFLLGVTATLAATAIYHGPMGKGDAFAASIEKAARAELDRQEMVQIDARLERGPLRRTLVLSGPADHSARSSSRQPMSRRWKPSAKSIASTPR